MKRRIRIKWPVTRFVSLSQAAAILLLVTVVAFWLGFESAGLPFLGGPEFAEIADGKKRIRLLENSNSELQEKVALAERSARLQLSAAEKMKTALRGKDSELLDLTRELHFYRTLFLPDAENGSVRVRAFKLKKDIADDRFAYILVLAGIPRKEGKLSGVVSLAVEGEHQGIAKKLEFIDTGKAGDGAPLKFSFKYFQEISGNFILPEGFEPGSVHIKLLPDGKKEKPVMVSYNWDEVFGKTGPRPGVTEE